MITKIRRRGNSYVIVVPPEEIKDRGIDVEQDLVEVHFYPVTTVPRLRPEVQAALNKLAPQMEEPFEYLADR